nr:hypothetical protein [Tanacetum cinerariifolium]
MLKQMGCTLGSGLGASVRVDPVGVEIRRSGAWSRLGGGAGLSLLSSCSSPASPADFGRAAADSGEA